VPSALITPTSKDQFVTPDKINPVKDLKRIPPANGLEK